MSNDGYFPHETGKLVYERTYPRAKPDGSKEIWPETVERVVDGNLSLVDDRYHLPGERSELIELTQYFKSIPAGRHLWASGVKGRQYLFNCHVSGWGDDLWDHFEFTFLRLMEGGGVGANYSNRFLDEYPNFERGYNVHVVCDPEHPDYDKMVEAGVISTEYVGDWAGAYEVEDSREGWANALVDLFDAYYREAKHTNRVFDVSRVRQEGARLKTFGGRASGPLPLAQMLREVSEIMNRSVGAWLDGISAMEIDHAIAKCVVSGGNRRSARMAIMHWDDPQVVEFLKCKEDTGKHWTTNISVEVDRDFYRALFQGETHALLVLDHISKGMRENGEPGVWDSTISNIGEPNEVVCTNPCGEIALEPWENCNLGHINLAAFVDENGELDTVALYRAHELMTRFLMRATFGDVNDSKQADVLARNRRIGVGHFGFASAIAKMGIKYSDAPQSHRLKMLLLECARVVDEAATAYAHQLRIPVPVKKRTVAPTGTIAKMPGVSEGVHPIFSRYFIRRIRFSTIDPDQFHTAAAYAGRGYLVEPCQYAASTVVVAIPTKDSLLAEVEAIYGEDRATELVQGASDLTLDEMIGVQAMYQTFWSDNAVSYTANIDPEYYTDADIAEVIERYSGLVKGFTVFPELSRPQSPYERLSKEEYEASTIRDIGDGVDDECATGACPVR